MRAFIIAAAVVTAAFLYTEQGYAQVNMGVVIGGGDRDGFYVSIGNYYNVPRREVMIVRDRVLRDEEIPVVFYFAEMAGVRPSVIVDLREDGYTWMDIAMRFRLNPSMFYDPVYGRPHGYDGYRPGRTWGTIRYDDDDFIRFCNVRFLSRQYHYRPDHILRMRDQHRDFIMIHNNIWRENNRGEAREYRQERNERNERHDNRRNAEEWRGNTQKAGNQHENGNTNRNDDRKQNQERRRPGRER